MSEPLWQPRSNLAARLLGVGFSLIGAGLLAQQTHSILQSIADDGPVSYFAAAIGLGEFAVVTGIFWMIGGLPAYTWLRTFRERPAATRGVTIGALVVIGGSIAGLRYWLSTLGYEW